MPAPSMPHCNELKAALRSAVSLSFSSDRHLFTNRVHEACVSHRLAVYLENHLKLHWPNKQWNVDCEYNVEGEARKDQPIRGRPGRRADIIIHIRGPNGPNLFLIEVKWSDNRRIEEVKLRVPRWVRGERPESGKPPYKLGALIIFEVESNPPIASVSFTTGNGWGECEVLHP